MPSQFDRLAVGLSFACIIHCLAPLLLALPLLGLSAYAVTEEVFHWSLLLVTIPVSAFAIVNTRRHTWHWRTTSVIVIGVLFLIGAFLVPESLHVLITLAGTVLIAIGHLTNLYNYRQLAGGMGQNTRAKYEC